MYNLSENITAPHSSKKLQECSGSNTKCARYGRVNNMLACKEEAKSPLDNMSLADVNSYQKVTTKKKKI